MKTNYLFLGFCLLIFCIRSEAQPENYRLNQLGYYPAAIKIASIIRQPESKQFFIISSNGDTAFRGSIGPGKSSAYSSMHTWSLDFTPLKKQGHYRIFIKGMGSSYPFIISDTVYEKLGKALVRAFYIQRSGTPITKEYAGKWARNEGHPDTVVLVHASAADVNRPKGTVISTPGGWYDAGDYNKYIVNSGITMATMLSAFEDYPEYFTKLHLKLPESGNGVPDLLNELAFNLKWMLSMQDPSDGGVYHKCTNEAFDPMIMPEKCTKPRYVVEKTTAAALDFAAVTAQAARVFIAYNHVFPELASKCLQASQAAWKWAVNHPDIIYEQDVMNKIYQPSVTTGAYGDRHLNDEKFWACSELYITTKEDSYLNELRKEPIGRLILPSWADVKVLGWYSLIRFEKKLPPAIQNKIAQMKDSLLHQADIFIDRSKSNAFATIMGQSKSDFVWGSNAVAANQGMLLLNAFHINKKPEYLEAAQSNIDYILGRNATGYCFVTGFGSFSTLHPHHRLSIADGVAEPVPGWLAGGPNPGMQDGRPYPLKETELAYFDDDGAYASNEIAINWNAPAVYLVHGIIADRHKAKRTDHKSGL